MGSSDGNVDKGGSFWTRTFVKYCPSYKAYLRHFTGSPAQQIFTEEMGKSPSCSSRKQTQTYFAEMLNAATLTSEAPPKAGPDLQG